MNSSTYKAFVRDNLTVIASHILVYLKGLFLMPLIIKTVGVAVYGGFTLITSILSIVLGLSSFGVGFRTRRFLPSANSAQERKKLFYPQFIFQLLSILFFSFVLIGLDKYLRIYLFKGEITYEPYVIPLYLVTYILFAQGCDYFRYTSRIGYMTVAGLVFPYTHIAFLLVCYYFFSFISIDVLMLSHAASAFLVSLPCFWILYKEIGFEFSFFTIKEFISDLRLGFPLTIAFLFDVILASFDRYFIAFFLTVSDVGCYTLAYTLGSMIIFVPKAMGTALPQLLSKAIDSQNEKEAFKMLNYAIKFFLLLAIPFIFGCLVLGKPLLSLFSNTEVADRAFWATPVIALGTLFYGLNLILTNVLFVRLNTKAISKINIFAALFNVLANAVFLFSFRNILVSAITTFLSYFLSFLFLSKVVSGENWRVDFHPGIALKSLAASVIMSGVLLLAPWHLINLNPVILFMTKFALGCFIYFILVLFFNAISIQELRSIRGGLN